MRISHSRILARRALLSSSTSSLPCTPSYSLSPPSRPFFSFFKRTPKPSAPFTPPPAPQLLPNDLFHPLSHSPFPALVDKADRIKAASLCPVSYERYGERVRPRFDCPDCGFPTHKDEQRWTEGLAEHKEYCGRLREVNEDEHDIRSGRKMAEFENMPAEQPYEAAVSFTAWDNFFFTRDFPSIDSDRAIRHVSKVLTYPITIAGVLHQNGPYTHGNGRITSQGRRSMAAIHSILHLPPGSSSDTAPEKPQPPFRIFLLGARAESTLPPSIWEQFTHLFPRTNFNIYFIGPEVGLPLLDKNSARVRAGYDFGPAEESEYGVPSYTLNVSSRLRLISLKGNYEGLHQQLGPFDPYTDVFFAFSPGLGFPHQGPLPDDAATQGNATGSVILDRAEEVPASEKSSSADAAANAYSLPEAETTPSIDNTGSIAHDNGDSQAKGAQAVTLDRADVVPPSQRSSTAESAANAYSLPEAETTPPIDETGSVAADNANGSSSSASSDPTQPLVQAQTSWAKPLRQILRTKCPLFFTAFSPLDLERDVSALNGTTPPSGTAEFPSFIQLRTRPVGRIDGVSDEFELVLSPGKNEFGSLKWEIAEWDVRVGVKTNWGVWGIRGKKYEVVGGEERD